MTGELLFDAAEAYPPAAAVRAAGFAGVIAYLSDRRPGAGWMQAKPLTRSVADSYRAAGLEIVSNYQFGKAETADWRGGFAAGQHHGARCNQLHLEAGGPAGAPLYAPVDDGFGPGYAHGEREFYEQVVPFLEGWASIVGWSRTGVYCNYWCIDRLADRGIAPRWFWQHGWGRPGKETPHPRAHLLQFEIDKARIGGIGIDRNLALQADYGQWSAHEDNWDPTITQLMGPIA